MTGFNGLIDTSTGQGQTGGRFFFQMNPGLHCPIVMVGSGSTDVGMNVTLTDAFFSGIVLAVGVP